MSGDEHLIVERHPAQDEGPRAFAEKRPRT